MKQKQSLEIINTAWMLPGVKCWVQIGTEDSDTFPDLFAKASIVELVQDMVVVTYENPDHQNLPLRVAAGIISQINNLVNNETFEDMVAMEILNEAEILNNLKIRYSSLEIFTYIGPTLLAMNPYQPINHLLGQNILAIYQEQARRISPFNMRESRPHTYAISAYAYRKLFENCKNQAIVISGESGAGKTENAKIAMKFLTSLSELESGEVDSEKQIQLLCFKRIEEKIMACNPILESFGNAKTVRNDNSSRFGKYVRIIVNSESRKIKGAAINNYLLEKSRVVGPGPQERNYHVFYQLLKCPKVELLKEWGFLDTNGNPLSAKDFEFLSVGQCTEMTTINDIKWYEEVREEFQSNIQLTEAFQNINFAEAEFSTIFNALAAVIHLGNLKFDSSTLTDKNPCIFKNQECFQHISRLFDIQEEELMKSLTLKTREVGKTIMESPLNEKDAISNKNALASNMYDRIFSWLVKRLNLTIIPKEDLFQTTNIRKSIKIMKRQSMLGKKVTIGLLDIFGFENFGHNSFEQFCINYTNEKLQQLYISYVFKSEEQEFINEGLADKLSSLNYSDNSEVINMMDKGQTGIFDQIDEATQLGSGTDEQLYSKIIKLLKDNPKLVAPKIQKDKFSIVHTAKNVEYTITGFRMKNKSEISGDLVRAVISSKNLLLHQVFLVVCGSEVEHMQEELEKMKKPTKIDKFLGAKFRSQMKTLMEELSQSDCHFIRCLKPNELKRKECVIASYCLLQIKYLGVLDSIKVRKEGFPYRKDYKVFYQQFHELSQNYRNISVLKQNGDFKEIATQILSGVLSDKMMELVLFGKQKLFAKDNIGRQLDMALSEWQKKKSEFARKIQRTMKTFLFKRKVLKHLHKLALKIKKFYRIMAHFRRRKQRRIFLAKKECIKRANNYYWKQNQKSGFHLYIAKVRLVIKHERHEKALLGLMAALYHVKMRTKYGHSFALYKVAVIRRKDIQLSVEKSNKYARKKKLRCLRYYQSQIKLKIKQEWEAAEKKRIAEKERLEELEKQKQLEEARKAEENRRIQEEKQQEELRKLEQKRLEEVKLVEARVAAEKKSKEEAQKLEDERLAQVKLGQIAEAERVKREMECLQEEKENREREEQRMISEKKLAEEHHLKQQKELHLLSPSQGLLSPTQGSLEKLKKHQQDSGIKIIEQQVEKSVSPIEQRPKPNGEIDKKLAIIPNELKSGSNSQKIRKSKTLKEIAKKAILLKQEERDAYKYENRASLLQIPLYLIEQADDFQEEPEKINFPDTDSDEYDESREQENQQESNSPSEEQKTKQIAQRMQEEEEQDAEKRRKRVTISNNVIPFIPKSLSKFESYLVDQTLFSIPPPCFNQIPTSSDFLGDLDRIDKSFMKRVQTSHFFDYCQSVFRKRTRYLSEITVEKFMIWSKDPLEKPLLIINQTLEPKWKQLLSLIIQFAGEGGKPSQSDPAITCLEIIELIFKTEVLTDETYFMVIKQIIKNSTATQLKYSQLLVGLASAVAPSPRALFPTLNFLEIASKSFEKGFLNQQGKIPLVIGVQSEAVADLNKFAFLRLVKTFSRGRSYTPSISELQLTFAYRQILVPIQIYQGNYEYVAIEPHFTERQLIESIVRKFEMYLSWDNLGIVMCNNDCETFLDENSLIVDALKEIETKSTEFQVSSQSFQQLQKSGNSSGKRCPFLAIRLKVFYLFQPEDVDSICIYFLHFCSEFLKGNFPLNQEQVGLMAAMKLINDFGCLASNKGNLPNFNSANYIPFKYLGMKDCCEILLMKYKVFPKMEKMQARVRFLDELKGQPIFMAWQYPCTYQVDNQLAVGICLALRPFKMFICDEKTKKIKKLYHLLQVVIWSQQRDEINVETEDGKEHRFKMQRGIEDAIGLNCLMKIYMDRALLQQQDI